MKKIITFLLAFSALLVFTGCTQNGQEEEESKYHVYYVDLEETQLEETPYEPEDESTEAMVKELLGNAIDIPTEDRMMQLIPDKVTVNTFDLTNGVLTVDFSGEYKEMGVTRELLTRAGMVKMFVQLDDIDSVRITVEGEELKDSKGTAIGPMDESSFVENAGEDINSYKFAELTLYFTNKAGDALIPESRKVYYNSSVTVEQVVVEQIVNGTKQDNLYNTLDPKTNILGVTTVDDICYINFDETFIDNALGIQESIPIYSLVNSLADSCQIKQVQISVNGESNMTFRETMNLDQFYEKNTDLIAKE